MQPLTVVAIGAVVLVLVAALILFNFSSEIFALIEQINKRQKPKAPVTNLVDPASLRSCMGLELPALVEAVAGLACDSAWLTNRLRNGQQAARATVGIPLASEPLTGIAAHDVVDSDDDRRQASFVVAVAQLLEHQMARLESGSFEPQGEKLLQLVCTAARAALRPGATLAEAPELAALQWRIGSLRSRVVVLSRRYGLIRGQDF